MVEVLRKLFIDLPSHMVNTAITIAPNVDFVELTVYLFGIIVVYYIIEFFVGGFINVFKRT